MKSNVWAIIAGGGTAGHVVPALAIGRALVERGHGRDSILFVGSRRGIDERLVRPEGFPLVLLPGRGIARSLTVQNLAAVLGLAVAFVRSLVLVARVRPRVVVSMGGYAAAPCGLAAVLFRVPLVLAEQNAVPTATHRLLARFATASAVPFEGTPLPNATVTGNPVREEVLAIDTSEAGKREARRRLGLPVDGIVIAAFGGSLGARTINEAVFGLIRAWRDKDGISVRHVVGARDWDRVPADVVGDPGRITYQVVRYEENMPDLLAAADVAVCRAGGTVAELAVARLPAILVPLPIAPFDHQTENARALVRTGGAKVVPDSEMDAERLAKELDDLLAEPGRLRAMADAIGALARRDAAGRVADLVENHAR